MKNRINAIYDPILGFRRIEFPKNFQNKKIDNYQTNTFNYIKPNKINLKRQVKSSNRESSDLCKRKQIKNIFRVR